MTDLG